MTKKQKAAMEAAGERWLAQLHAEGEILDAAWMASEISDEEYHNATNFGRWPDRLPRPQPA